VAKDIGTLRPQRAVAVEQAHLSAFFDRFLRHHDNHLLNRPSTTYPEMAFVR
jgi:hypothetical protein